MKPGLRNMSPPARHQKGQALVLGMFILIIVAMLTFFQFSAGQVTTARMRLNNATDAAAYSVGLWHARVYNYYAYSNRAIIFSEVAIGQTATLVSYAGFLTQAVRNVEQYARYIPGWGKGVTAVKQMAEGLQTSLRFFSGVEVAARSAYAHALSAGQTAMAYSVNGLLMTQLATEVMGQTDKSFKAIVPSGLDNFTRSYEDKDRDRLKSLVTRSLDPYSRNRSNHIHIPWIPHLDIRFEWRGQTELIRDHEEDFDRWQAYDTLSMHQKRRFSFRKRRRELPIGWSGVEIARDPKGGVDRLDYWPQFGAGRDAMQDAPRANPSGEKTTNREAYRRINRDRPWSTGAYLGLASTRDLDYDGLLGASNPGASGNRRGQNGQGAPHMFPTNTVAVIGRLKKNNTISTAEQTGMGEGRLKLHDHFPDQYKNDAMLSVSMAQVYFRRPPGDDHRIEYASMYSPYWQVRLKEVSPEFRAKVAAGAWTYKKLRDLLK